MMLELNIPEEQLEEFEAWFDEHNPAPAKRETLSFSSSRGIDVVYRVRVSVRTQAAAGLLQQF